MLASRRPDLGSSIVAFIEASKAAAGKARRRTLLWRAAAAAAVLLVLVGGGLYWDFNFREHEEYYNVYTKRWGVFEGVGRVRASDVEHRSRTIRIVRLGRLGPVVSAKAIDGSGKCSARGLPDGSGLDLTSVSDDPGRSCTVVWDRNSRNQVKTHTVFDPMERVIVSLVYTDIEGRTAEFRTDKGHLLPMGSSATTVTFER